MRDIDEVWRELPAPPCVAAHGERTERIAVIALPARDEMSPLRLPDLDEILARELERGLDHLRAARHEIDVGRRTGNQHVGQLLGDRCREKARVREGKLIDLRVHRANYVRMTVAQARYGGAAGSIDVLAAVGIDEAHAVPPHGERQRAAQLAMKNVRHGLPLPRIGSIVIWYPRVYAAPFGRHGERARRLGRTVASRIPTRSKSHWGGKDIWHV